MQIRGHKGRPKRNGSMNTPDGPNGKITIGADGLGTVTQEMVECRARELAASDGRADFNAGDLERAKGELLGNVDPELSPEVDARTENLVAWDQATEERGSAAPKVGPEDEANIAEELVGEGLEEADHDQRVSASRGEELG